MMNFGEDELEIQLMSKRDANMFRCPPASSARGHKAEDWRGTQCWKGKVGVIMKGKRCLVQLTNPDGTLFVQSPIPEEYTKVVEKCYDSSRYFAILMENEMRQKALIGLGFDDRNDAFDFGEAFDKYRQMMKAETTPEVKSTVPEKDYSLKAGEKITISIGGMPSQPKPAGSGFGGGLKKLGAPPGMKPPQ